MSDLALITLDVFNDFVFFKQKTTKQYSPLPLAFVACPECGTERICHINQGNKSSSCECLPGSVEKDGECVWCHGECNFNMLQFLTVVKTIIFR